MKKYLYISIVLLFSACFPTPKFHFWTEDIQLVTSVENPKGYPISGDYFKGENKRGNYLYIAEVQEEDAKKWLENAIYEPVRSEEGIFYAYKVKGKEYFAHFIDGRVLYGPRAYMIENALRCFRGQIPSLAETFPLIETLGKRDKYFALSTLNSPLLKRIKELKNAKLLGTQKNAIHLFAGQLFLDKNYHTQKDSLWTEVFNIIPQNVSYFGVHNYKKETSDYQYYAKFHTKDILRHKDFEFVAIKYEENPDDILELWEQMYGVLSEKNIFGAYEIQQFNHVFLEEFPFIHSMKRPYVVAIEDCLVFCEKISGLENYLKNVIANKTLSFSTDFYTFSKKWQPSVLQGSVHFLNERNSSHSQWINCVATEKPSVIDVDVYSKKRKRSTQKNILNIGKKELSNVPITFLQVLPHQQRKWIVTQDEKHQVKVLNDTLKVLFTRYLDEKILGDIFHFKDYTTQLDRYVFNTATAIHLWNEKGENVHDFPLKMTTPLSGGIQGIKGINLAARRASLGFTRDENGRINAHDLQESMKLLPFWNPYMGDKIRSKKVAILNGHKELHFAFINDKNEFISLNRKAERRFPPLKIEPEFVGEIQVDANRYSRERFVLQNKKGRLKVINNQGGVFHLRTGKGDTYTLLSNIEGDEQKEYITLSGGEITIHRYNKKDDFEEVKVTAPCYMTQIFELETPQRSFFAAIGEDQKMYLYDKDGRFFNEPILGSSLAGILSVEDNKYILIAAFHNELFLHLVELSEF